MAQGRMLSRAISEDEALNRLSLEAHLFYLQTIPQLDRDGLITGRPVLLWSKALPLRPEFMEQAATLIEEWVEQELVIRYAGAHGEPVLFFKGFRRHNQNMPYSHEAPSPHPPPPGWLRTAHGLIPEDLEARRALAQTLDVRSQYRRALEDVDQPEHTFASRPHRVHVATGARPHRQEDQQKIKASKDDGDGVHTYAIHAVTEERGGGGGEGGPAGDACRGSSMGALHTPYSSFDAATLRSAAYQVGVLLFGHEWTGYDAYVSAIEEATLVDLLGWLQRFGDMDERAVARVESIPAVIRSYLNRGVKPPLTTKQQEALGEKVAQVQRLDDSSS